MSVINLIISIILIKVHAEIGAAVGTAVSLVIGDGIITNVYYHKKVGLNVWTFWKRIIRLAVSVSPSAVIGVIALLAFKPTSFIKSIPEIILVVVSYLLCLFFFGIDRKERNKISNNVFR